MVTSDDVSLRIQSKILDVLSKSLVLTTMLSTSSMDITYATPTIKGVCRQRLILLGPFTKLDSFALIPL